MKGPITFRPGIAALLIFVFFPAALGAAPGSPIEVSGLPAADSLLRFKIFPPDASVEIDGEKIELTPGPEETRQCAAVPGPHEIRLSREGYRDTLLYACCYEKVTLIEEKLERRDSGLSLFASIDTGPQPKSVVFSPDGRYIYAPLLDGPGIDVFRTADFSRAGLLTLPGNPPGISAADGDSPDAGESADNEPAGNEPAGFVECAISPLRAELWVTQMTTGRVHIFSLYGFRHLASIDTGGEWSKVIVIDSAERKAFVSNWLSRDVSIIDTQKRKLLGTVDVGGVPRGMALSGDERNLYVCLYEDGGIVKIDLEKRAVVKTIATGESAPRHIVRDPGTNRFYVSDMLNGTILVIDGTTDTLIRRIYAGSNPNTIDLTSDGKYLFVSTRGKNHPEGYLRKGHVFGRVLGIDTETFEIADWTWGGNQPTGLDVSPDDRFLAFSDFLDDRIEVYYLDRE